MADAPLTDATATDRMLANLRNERDAIALYDGLCRIERDPDLASAFRAIAATERRHAGIWEGRLREAGARVPPSRGPRMRVRFTLVVARLLGTRAVADLVRGMEADEESRYASQDGPEIAAIIADERDHLAMWHGLASGASSPSVAASSNADAAQGAAAAWQNAGRSGALRAAIFGVNDGLVSNLALVMGVAGASHDNQLIILAGVAGLLAGAFSMAAGEYISMQSQRELFERQIALEREALRIMPEVQRASLVAIYRAKGLDAAEADHVAGRLMEDPERALDTKLREDLGLDPSELGSPVGAAVSSFAAFGIGAVIPLAPFLVASGITAVAVSVTLALAALFLVGALVSLLTGRGLLYSGLRQVAIGGAAALVTYVVGSLIPVDLG